MIKVTFLEGDLQVTNVAPGEETPGIELGSLNEDPDYLVTLLELLIGGNK